MDDNRNDIITQYFEKDAEVLKENGLVEAQARLNSGDGEKGAIDNRYWKFIGGFFTLLFIGGLIIILVSSYIRAEELAAQRGEVIEIGH